MSKSEQFESRSRIEEAACKAVKTEELNRSWDCFLEINIGVSKIVKSGEKLNRVTRMTSVGPKRFEISESSSHLNAQQVSLMLIKYRLFQSLNSQKRNPQP